MSNQQVTVQSDQPGTVRFYANGVDNELAIEGQCTVQEFMDLMTRNGITFSVGTSLDVLRADGSVERVENEDETVIGDGDSLVAGRRHSNG